ncbi:unnamed protein product [Clonostachys rhizophaga]|uniref:Nitrogen regulatory protein areA GATA-like domain-containing protein n=1 Tax=Clonostachys rhizophaga TaxID=160324 RepID=A0A9N9V9J8_9HYPO|nr:unnamed protein product [Clonostachys rhizophaga]
MPHRLDTHVLTVDANVIHKVDTNPANLYSMWTVFSRCADSVEQGRRLENLSWRLWQKEQLIENEQKNADATESQTAPKAIPSASQLCDLPQLSGSVDSVADADETVEFTSVSAPLEIARPRILRQDSAATSRSKRDRHISSDDFEKMIVSIVKDKAPLSAPSNAAPILPTKEAMEAPSHAAIQRSGSTTTEASSKNTDTNSQVSLPSPHMQSRTNVVRGFSPSQASLPRTSQPSLARAEAPLINGVASKAVQSRKTPTTFMLGASYSSSEQGHSPEACKPAPAGNLKKSMFKLGGSSEEEGSLKSALSPRNRLTTQKKQASFSNHVIMHTVDPDNAIDSDSEGDYIDESAIDDEDDSSDWEDSIEDSGKSSVDDKYFQRVDSKVNLTSRRSLITLMLTQTEDRAKALSNHASQSTSAIPQSRNRNGPAFAVSPNDSDDAPLMMKGNRQPPLKPIREIPRSSAQPIPTVAHGQGQGALSPRTTRRNMLATELTESLRRHLLWERSQKSSTANAVLKRRHTSHDVANLKQFPEKSCMKKAEDVNASSWNQYFVKETFDGYHSKGW